MTHACDYTTLGEAGYASPHHGSEWVWQELPVPYPERPVAHLRRTTHKATAIDTLLHSTEVRVQRPAGICLARTWPHHFAHIIVLIIVAHASSSSKFVVFFLACCTSKICMHGRYCIAGNFSREKTFMDRYTRSDHFMEKTYMEY